MSEVKKTEQEVDQRQREALRIALEEQRKEFPSVAVETGYPPGTTPGVSPITEQRQAGSQKPGSLKYQEE